MKEKATILLSGLVAILMVTCAVPFMASEDSDALTHDSNMALNSDRAVIYVTSGSDHSFTFTAATTDGNTGSIAWKLNDIGDGSNNVSFDDSNSVYTASGSSATVYGKVAGSIEVEAYVVGDETNHHASAVVVVYPSPSTTATTFHFFIQIDSDAYDYALSQEDVDFEVTIPNEYSIEDFNNGVWITVTQNETGLSNANFNAGTAFDWYLNENGWDGELGSYSWINQLFNLSYYLGDEVYDGDEFIGNYYYYWAQYHLTNSGWEFNSTTLGFITTVEESYIGLIFWASPPTMEPPENAPDFPL